MKVAGLKKEFCERERSFWVFQNEDFFRKKFELKYFFDNCHFMFRVTGNAVFESYGYRFSIPSVYFRY